MRNGMISTTLEHVEIQRQELMDLIFNSKAEGDSVQYISNLVADVLGNINKCMDYCAKDLYEEFVSHDSTTKRIYFPLSREQLGNAKNPFSKIKVNENLYAHLSDLIDKINSDALIERTRIPYSIARIVRTEANSDKHDRLIEVDQEGREEIVAFNDKISFIIPKRQMEQNGLNIGNILPNQARRITTAKSYRLLSNNEDVADFILNAQIGIQQILDVIYKNFLEGSIISK